MKALQKRHQRIRKKIKGTGECPRLAVHRSNKHIYAQIIDDQQQRTLVFVSTLSPGIRKGQKLGVNKESASAVGKLIGEKALKQGIKKVVFDRGGYFYHGRVKVLAEAARKAGLKF